MPSQTSTQKKLLTSKTTESNWLVVSNLPEMSTEETIKEYFERYGHIQSIKIDKQHFAYIAFLDRHIASKAHYAENILNQQKLQTEFYNDSNLISKIFKETSPILTKSMHKHRTKHLSSPKYSHEENTRHQVVPIKDDSNQRMNNPKINQMKSSQQIYENASSSSASSEESHNDSMSHKDHVSELKRASLKTKILKISHLPSNISNQLLRDKLRNIFNDFQKPSHLLTIKIIDNYALLTFKNSDDINQALVFIKTQSINGDRLKAEPYHISITEKSEYNSMKRSLSSDIDIDEYSIKATRTLYIGNLPLDTSSNQLREKYSVYGEIIEIDVKRQEFQRPYAFIQYTDIKSVVKVLKSKLIHDHSIKLGFGKSQPTNILWLDNLPSNTTELALHTFLNQQTNISSDQILHIYIDNRNSEKTDVAQCLIYFSDTNSAQNAIDLIRGKMFDTKRIQVDFASRIFLKKFSDLIQQTDQNKNNDQLVRRYSKVSDTTNSSIITQNFDSHHLSSSSSSPCLIKSDQDKHANTSRIFDWLMQSDHTDRNNNHEKEEQIVEHKKTFLHTKIIPLQTNGLFIQSDIRLKIYSNDQYQQSIHSLRFLLPEFAKNLRKNSNVINPNAHFKFLFNNKSTHSNSVDYNSISATTATQPTIPPLTSIPSSLSNSISTKTSSNISSINFKHKLIPPPLSVIRTMSSSIDRNDASVCPTPKSITFINDIENQKRSLPSVTFSPISQKPQALKSILKPSSNLSSSKSNEIRKEVRIISTDSSSNTKINQKLPSNDQQKLKNPINKSQMLTKKTS